MESPYEMRLDLRVLDHLGIKLYSNAAAVLSEAVANSWDAEATFVSIRLSQGSIEIEDDGLGMNLAQINGRFLTVGYDKRHVEGEVSPAKKRPFMGRKGIGKLALFSIADTIEIDSRAVGGEAHAFRMKTADIRTAMQATKEYRPVPLSPTRTEQGTLIRLLDLKRRATAATESGLRKRIARRFTIIGYEGTNGDRFNVEINGNPVGPHDRDDLNKLEFLWEFGSEERLRVESVPRLKKRHLRPGVVTEQKADWMVRGWFGTVAEPKQLKSSESGSLNTLTVVARGRLIQENILDKLNFNRLMSNYLTGQIEADFLDAPGLEDIATSDRQRLIEDDERYVALTHFLRSELVAVSDQWTEMRNEVRGKQAEEENPALKEWLQGLPEGQVPAARRLLGLIQGVELEDESERRDLFRAGLTAFERLRLREESHKLGEQKALTAEQLLPLLADLASLEAAMYSDIVRSRLDVIRKFEGLVDGNAKEKVLQEHLFKNLWLLDPGWERATESPRIEQTLKNEFMDFADDLDEEQSKGRIDIRYRTNAGEHILVELKRAHRQMSVPELIEQGSKYVSALKTLLARQNNSTPSITLVFLLGRAVKEERDPHLGRNYVAESLQPLRARVMYYDQLINQAQAQYAAYLERQKDKDKVGALLERIEATKQAKSD
ncbi:MAG: hypothetical protein BroJett031_15900 [Betaproteobacteria bacterium]|nr:MAG: hypothetical protein BroJett031_15900 [Betaproteobacteria bacterium]